MKYTWITNGKTGFVFCSQPMPSVHSTRTCELYLCLKGQCKEVFCFMFFPWIIFPQAPANNIRVISNFFYKFSEIIASQGAPPVSTTPVAMMGYSRAWGKLFHEKTWSRKSRVTVPLSSHAIAEFPPAGNIKLDRLCWFCRRPNLATVHLLMVSQDEELARRDPVDRRLQSFRQCLVV